MILRLLVTVLFVLGALLSVGCDQLADEVRREATQAAEDEINRQAEQIRNEVEDGIQDAADSARDTIGISKSVEPDMSHYVYIDGEQTNPFWSYYGHCTWFVWARAYEKWGIELPMRGHAGTWYDPQRFSNFTHSSTPRADSIAVWSSGEFGHVAYVEEVRGDVLVLNEANWGPDASFGQRGSGYEGSPTEVRVSDMSTRLGTLLGYVYLPVP